MTAATIDWPSSRCRKTGSRARCSRAARRYGSAAHRRADRHQHLRHPADRARLSPPRSAHRRAASGLRLSPTATTRSPSRTTCAADSGLRGPAVSICTACSSSAKVFAAAQRLIAAELIDAAVVGGVDSLCLTTLYGFHSLQLTAREPCRPFDRAREGLSIGEAAAFALLERAPSAARCGRCAAARHRRVERCLSHVESASRGRRRAERHASRAAAAGLDAADIDYINLHGTGTPEQRRRRSARGRGVVRRRHRLQLDQGGHRSRARRRRRARGGDLCARAASAA